MASSGGVSIIGIMAWHGINLNGESAGGKSSKIMKIGGIAVAKIINIGSENGGESWRKWRRSVASAKAESAHQQ
jgi:hypothetical protein